MWKFIIPYCALLLVPIFGYGQQIVRLEYSIDSDPGYGAATTLPVAPGEEIDLMYNLDFSTLTGGAHVLFARVENNLNQWSSTIIKPFIIDNLTPVNIVKAEYYVDSDPGFGAGFPVPLVPAVMQNIDFTLHPSIPNGIHLLYVRVLDELGQWSSTLTKLVFVVKYSNPQIAAAEYFIDEDPGYGLGTPIPVAAANEQTLSFTIYKDGLATGLHTLFVRARDGAGNWSITGYRSFFYDGTKGSDVQAMEYFFDTDPGFGNATSVSIPAGQRLETLFDVEWKNLDQGLHQFYVRIQNGDGSWSLCHAQAFHLASIKAYPEGLYDAVTGTLHKAMDADLEAFGADTADVVEVITAIGGSGTPQAVYQQVAINTAGLMFVPINPSVEHRVGIKHRNSIETWSANGFLPNDFGISYDFTMDASSALGLNTKEVAGVYCLMAGDCNQDGLVDALDLIALDNAAAILSSGYLPEDINHDGHVNDADVLLTEENAQLFARSFTP